MASDVKPGTQSGASVLSQKFELSKGYVEIWLAATSKILECRVSSEVMAALCRAWLASQWQPISTVPTGKLVLLMNEDRHRSDDILGCVKDIGYLTVDGYFSTFGEHRGMAREAFTHWSEYTLPEPPHD